MLLAGIPAILTKWLTIFVKCIFQTVIPAFSTCDTPGFQANTLPRGNLVHRVSARHDRRGGGRRNEGEGGGVGVRGEVGVGG